jgi:delta24(24(1))-sterol reductase
MCCEYHCLTILIYSKPTYLKDYVETPGTYRRMRKSLAPVSRDGTAETEEQIFDRIEVSAQAEADSKETVISTANGSNGHANGHTNGHANGTPKRGRGRPRKEVAAAVAVAADPKVDTSGEFEFGGSLGVGAMMIGFPLLMWYMWIGATYYDGKFPTREAGQNWSDFGIQLFGYVKDGAFPHAKAWAIYWTFFVVEGLFYLFMPGVYAKGKPLPHEGGKQLDYYCSGMWSWYSTIVLAIVLHFTGIFRLYTLIDEFGSLMSVAILSGYLVSFIAYFSALYRGAQHRMTGAPVYDFFMGAELNPRLFGWLDFKMFFEVRLPWFILFLLSLGTAARQYETYGYVSPEVGFVLMAHFLYANACAKGEELIVTTW